MFFFFFNEPIWLAHSLKKLKLITRIRNKEGFILECIVCPLWPTYIGERRTTFAKAYRIKVRCYWELFEEHARNLGTLCFDLTQAFILVMPLSLALTLHMMFSIYGINSCHKPLDCLRNIPKRLVSIATLACYMISQESKSFVLNLDWDIDRLTKYPFLQGSLACAAINFFRKVLLCDPAM